MNLRRYMYLGIGVVLSLSFYGGETFSRGALQEVTYYESYHNKEETRLVDTKAKLVKTVPHDLGDVLVDHRGRLKKDSILQYSFAGMQSLCSLAVKLFLQEVTGGKPFQGVTGDAHQLRKGDAIRLIMDGKRKGLLQEMPHEYRGVRRFLTKMRQKNRSHSLYDVFIYTPNSSAEYESEAWYLQGHRIVIFLGSDAHWYVYDPFIAPFTTKPHKLKTYIDNDLWQGGTAYTLSHGYAPYGHMHSSAGNDDGSMQVWLDDAIDTIHENTLGEIEDYIHVFGSLIDTMKRPLPPLI